MLVTIFIPIITRIADGTLTSTTVTEWVGVGTAIILGTTHGTILGITVTDTTTTGIARGTIAVGTRLGITEAGIAPGTTAAGTHLGIMEAITHLTITATADGTAADTIAVSTMDTTVA